MGAGRGDGRDPDRMGLRLSAGQPRRPRHARAAAGLGSLALGLTLRRGELLEASLHLDELTLELVDLRARLLALAARRQAVEPTLHLVEPLLELVDLRQRLLFRLAAFPPREGCEHREGALEHLQVPPRL